MLKDLYPYYLANRPVQANRDLEVLDKYSGAVATRVALAGPEAIERAIAAAAAAEGPMRALPAWQRQKVLEHCARTFAERAEELAQALCVEAGKPIRDSRGEVTRLIDTFRIAAEESVRMDGEYMAFDRSPRTTGYVGMSKRVPIGPCSFITPFNFPLNLAAHKVAPAIAAGCPFVLKPSPHTPIGSLILGEALAETDLPEGAFSILPCRTQDAAPLVEDERLKLLSFTGSAGVGWSMKAKAGRKKVVLELGGNAACIVDADADLEDVVRRMIVGAFYQSGQSCISVQRILVHERVYDVLRDRLVAATQVLKMGDPRDEETFIGPLINEDAARRLEAWIQSAVSRGAQLLCGGRRDGAMLEPTLLENVPKDEKLCLEEAFGPVAVLARFRNFDEALRQANDTAYGLQAGVFTHDIRKAHRAWDTLEVGGVIINDVPSWRADQMPYGGVKGSGFGREGVRYAMQDITEVRMMVVRLP
jgi:acyl-CoA reductase-like NAD-dependent aldehyde dehydrogenase